MQKKLLFFCVTTGTANTNCVTITSSKRVASGGVTKLYYTNWDGDLASCKTGTHTCETSALFTID